MSKVISQHGQQGPETRPLLGRRVAILRKKERAGPLRDILEALGARCLVVGVLRHGLAANLAPLRGALGKPEAYSHLLFTSRTAVQYFAEALASLQLPLAPWQNVRVAAVGPQTATALHERGLEPVLVASGGGASLAQALLDKEGLGSSHRVLLPRSAIGHPELCEILEEAGVTVDPMTVYETETEESSKVSPLLAAAFAESAPDAVVLSSPSAFAAFLDLADSRGREAVSLGHSKIVSIGSTTSRFIAKRGFSVAAEASSPTAEALARATVRALVTDNRDGQP